MKRFIYIPALSQDVFSPTASPLIQRNGSPPTLSNMQQSLKAAEDQKALTIDQQTLLPHLGLQEGLTA